MSKSNSKHNKLIFFRDTERINRLEWIITLRWTAILFLLSATFAAEKIFQLSFQSNKIYLIILFLIFYNFSFLQFTKRLKSKNTVPLQLPDISHKFAFIQGAIDLFFLTIILHYSGGIENPFFFFYIFHIIIAGLLLSQKTAYILAIFSCLLITILSTSECFSVIPHYSIEGFLKYPLYNNKMYLFTINTVFCLTIIISVSIMSSINKRILKKEEDLEALKDQLGYANNSLKEQDKKKSEYVITVAHDLKSPLVSIKSLLNILTGKYMKKLNPDSMEVFRRISKRVDGLIFFIDDLLNLSKIRSYKLLKNEEVNIINVINTTLNNLTTITKIKNITIEKDLTDNLTLIKGNRDEFSTLFSNLFTNAIRYNKENGKVKIKVKKDYQHIVIEISDTGIGIEKKDLPYIFEEFFRSGKAKKHSPEGSGLGLSLVKCITERYGGRVKVESKLEQGTKFTVTFKI